MLQEKAYSGCFRSCHRSLLIGYIYEPDTAVELVLGSAPPQSGVEYPQKLGSFSPDPSLFAKLSFCRLRPRLAHIGDSARHRP